MSGLSLDEWMKRNTLPAELGDVLFEMSIDSIDKLKRCSSDQLTNIVQTLGETMGPAFDWSKQEHLENCIKNIYLAQHEYQLSDKNKNLLISDLMGIYSCKTCDTWIAYNDNIQSKGYSIGGGHTGYLFTAAINLELSDAKTQSFITGTYQTSRVSCITCNTEMGWKYISAQDPDNNVRVGRFCLAMHLLKSSEESTSTTEEEEMDENENLQTSPDGWVMWKIGGSLLEEFRSAQQKAPFFSTDFYKFGINFSLRCYPNGYYQEGQTDIDLVCNGLSTPVKLVYSMVCNAANSELNDSKEITGNKKLIEMKKVFDHNVWNQKDEVIIQFKIWRIFSINDALQLVTWKLTSDQFKAKTINNEFRLNGIDWVMDVNSHSVGLRLKKCFLDSSSMKIYRKIECQDINDQGIIVYNVDSENINSSIVYDKQWKNGECLEIKCYIQLLSVEYRNQQIISLQAKTKKEIKDLKQQLQQLSALKESGYICSKIMTENETKDSSNDDEKQSDNLQQEEYNILFDNHEEILNEWNANTMKLNEFVSPKQKQNTQVNMNNDENKESNALTLLQQNIECNELIDEQRGRLSTVTSDNHLLQLLKIQNELITQQEKLEKESSIGNKQLNNTTKQYQLTQNKRIQVQKSIEEQIKVLNQTINAENELLLTQKKIQINVHQQDEQIQQIKLLSEKCASLVHKYNDFMQINQTKIDKSTSYFKSKWNELESKWYDWITDDILGWFKYKTQSMNTTKIEWEQIRNELEKQNIYGKLLHDFTENRLYMIGIHDFSIRNYISKCIDILKAKYPLNQNHEDNEQKIAEEFICPITKQIMKDPVIAFDAHTYERRAIEEYLKMHQKSPTTNAKAFTSTVFPNIPLKQRIQSYQHVISTQKNNNNEANEGDDTVYID